MADSAVGPPGKACTRCGLLVTQFGWARLGSTETDPRLVVSVPRLVVRSLGLIPVTPGGWPPCPSQTSPLSYYQLSLAGGGAV